MWMCLIVRWTDFSHFLYIDSRWTLYHCTICLASLPIVTLFLIIDVFTPFYAFTLCYLCAVLWGPLGLILYKLGALGSESDPVVPEGEVYNEAPIVKDFGWETNDLADQAVDWVRFTLESLKSWVRCPYVFDINHFIHMELVVMTCTFTFALCVDDTDGWIYVYLAFADFSTLCCCLNIRD